MYASEVLDWMKCRIDEYHYELLEMWIKRKEYTIFKRKRKFTISKPKFNKGYVVEYWFDNFTIYM